MTPPTRTIATAGLALGVFAAAFVSGEPAAVSPQLGGPATAEEAAPIDLTGYWVSVVSEDWRHRMATPRRGDYESIPISAAGRRMADQWDLEADNEAGLECRAFGVGGLIRQPGRIHITWEDPDTLRLDFSAGTQTRLLHFDAASAAPEDKTWQGHSTAQWERAPAGRGGATRAQIGNNAGPVVPGGGGRGQRGGPPQSNLNAGGGSLAVVTTGFRSGYLRKNGVPYSESARITEYFHRLPETPGGDVWLLVITQIEDPEYLNGPYYTSTQFRLEPDGSNWEPTPCRTPPPPEQSL
jgi:hypothetical protein